jgi:hypothetical protein
MTATPLALANLNREEQAIQRADDVLWLVERGEEPSRAAARCGTTLGAVSKTLTRLHRHADWTLIANARPLPIHSTRK